MCAGPAANPRRPGRLPRHALRWRPHGEERRRAARRACDSPERRPRRSLRGESLHLPAKAISRARATRCRQARRPSLGRPGRLLGPRGGTYARRRPPQWTHLIPEDRVDPPRAGGNAGGRRLLNRLGLQSAGRWAAPLAQLPPAARARPPSEVGPACGGHLSRPSRPAPSRAPAAPSPAGLEGPAEQRGCRPDEASSSSPPLPAGEEDPALSSGSYFRYQRSCSCTCRLTPGPLTLGGGCGLLNRLLPPGSPPQLS